MEEVKRKRIMSEEGLSVFNLNRESYRSIVMKRVKIGESYKLIEDGENGKRLEERIVVLKVEKFYRNFILVQQGGGRNRCYSYYDIWKKLLNKDESRVFKA